MEHERLVGPIKVSVVALSAAERHVRLSLYLSHLYTGGDLVRFSSSADVSIKGCDELSGSYNRQNWASGISSGALYAFRKLHVPRRSVVVIELTGQLRAEDMEALANGAAIAVAKFVGNELSSVTPEGWTLQTELKELLHSSGLEKREGESGLTSIAGVLHSMPTHDLLDLLMRDRDLRRLSMDELQIIHDIAIERMKSGDKQADTILAEVGSFPS